MGLIMGCIGSATMLAILMGNAGGAWDNAKKLCEKLDLKKTEQGKACIVGDTVGDPYKDTSGPSLDILLKLLSMVGVLITPLIAERKGWEGWWIGLIPLFVGIVSCAVLVKIEVLTWKDPLSKMVEEAKGTKGSNGMNANEAWA